MITDARCVQYLLNLKENLVKTLIHFVVIKQCKDNGQHLLPFLTVVDFIPLTIGGYNMFTMIKEDAGPVWKLSPLDRCDRCQSEALVQVTGLNGDLLFCGHHYNKAMNSAIGYDKIMKFAITILDEREKLAV